MAIGGVLVHGQVLPGVLVLGGELVLAESVLVLAEIELVLAESVLVLEGEVVLGVELVLDVVVVHGVAHDLVGVLVYDAELDLAESVLVLVDAVEHDV